MPYMVVERDGEFCVYKKENERPAGESLGCHPTAEKARAQIAAIWANESLGKSLWVTVEQMAQICPDCAERMRRASLKSIDLCALKVMPEQMLQGLCARAGADPGFWSACAGMSWGPIDDVEGFCNWLHYECLGSYPGEHAAASYEVKSLGGDRIHFYGAIWGDPEHTDLSAQRDYFTKATDLWLQQLPLPQPMIYHHAQDPATAADPVIGKVDARGLDDAGLWYEGELDKAHRYRAFVDQLIADHALAASSDSVPHLVVRRPAGKGAHELVRWPIVAVSLTPTPAEPRLLPVEALKAAYKAIGVELPDLAQADAGASGAMEAARARAQAVQTRIRISQSEVNHVHE